MCRCITFLFIYYSFARHLSRLFPDSGYYIKSCNEDSGEWVLVVGWNSIWVNVHSATVESWGRSISNFLRNYYIDSHSCYIFWYCPQPWKSVPLAPHPHQKMLSLELLIFTILTFERWNLKVVLTCICLIDNHVEHLLLFLSHLLVPLLRIHCLDLCSIFKWIICEVFDI